MNSFENSSLLTFESPFFLSFPPGRRPVSRWAWRLSILGVRSEALKFDPRHRHHHLRRWKQKVTQFPWIKRLVQDLIQLLQNINDINTHHLARTWRGWCRGRWGKDGFLGRRGHRWRRARWYGKIYAGTCAGSDSGGGGRGGPVLPMELVVSFGFGEGFSFLLLRLERPPTSALPLNWHWEENDKDGGEKRIFILGLQVEREFVFWKLTHGTNKRWHKRR